MAESQETENLREETELASDAGTSGPDTQPPADSLWSLFVIFLKLGLTSFGGPTAHIGYFRQAFVAERKWMTDRAYAELVALCQTLPGPASSQVGLGVGYLRGGVKGACVAWLGFTAPSAVIMALFAMGVADGTLVTDVTLELLKVIAAVVVFQALWGMTPTLAPDFARRIIALLSVVLSILASGIYGPLIVVIVGAVLGFLIVDTRMEDIESPGEVPTDPLFPRIALGLFCLILLALPITPTGHHTIDLFESMFRVGSLVFGGGHVVLPLMNGEFVDPGSVSAADFVAGYGAAQGVPGPMFTLASYLGVLANPGPGGWIGAAVATVGIFLPSFLLVVALLPSWVKLGSNTAMRHTLAGVNAAVLGLLAWTFAGTVLPDALNYWVDALLIVIVWVGVHYLEIRVWKLVLASVTIGWFF